MRGKLTGVTIDKMMQMHSRLGKSVDVKVKRQQRRTAPLHHSLAWQFP